MTVYAWHTESTARQLWRDAPSSAEVQEQLDASQEQCLEFATSQPAEDYIVPPEGIPARWRIAHLIQARALWTAKQANPQDQLGVDGIGVRVYPMDMQVKALLRPKRAMPGIG